MRNILWIVLLPLLLASCVSKKKHLAALTVADATADSLSYRLDSTTQLVYQLRLDTAERRGENNALLASQDKLQDRIIALDDEIERMDRDQSSEVEDLDARLKERDALIAEREARIDAIRTVLQTRSAELDTLAFQLLDTLQRVDSAVFTLEVESDGVLSLSVLSDYLFYPGSTTRLEETAAQTLLIISQYLAAYPTLQLTVVGHNNNQPLNRKHIDSKWEFSAMRAATLVNELTRKYELSTSRATAAGKGDFAPRASNTTEEGRALNERMEFRIEQGQRRLLRDLKRALDTGNP
ncbi:MAG: OmpA family protein [Phaeodactylibacter sp.]|uniref:OmpA family protein n=1 Tax=Phaeodactylibacter sp. TaxID=1940289 RepID=UPI0032EF6624